MLVGRAQEISATQFERDQKTVEEQVESLVAAEFTGMQANFDLLKKPLAVGDAVTVEIRRGGSRETVDGRFRGIVGSYVRISSKSLLLADVSEFQRDRFIVAQFPEQRETILAKRQLELTTAMEQKRRRLRPTVLRDAGYGPAFFDENILLGRYVYPKKKLGSGEVFAVITAVEGDELLSCRLVNRSRMPVSAVAILDNSGVGTSVVENALDSGWGGQFDFVIPRTRFLSLDRFLASFRILCHSTKMGTWSLKPLPATKRKTR